MEIKRFKLSIEFITGPLGTQPQKDVATEFITGKVAERVEPKLATNGAVATAEFPLDQETGLPADELATLPEQLEKGTTAFHKLNGLPIYYDYMIKGFLKEAGQVFNGLRNVKNLRSKVDNFVFVTPRQISLCIPVGGELTHLERPLRAQTMQGPRTSLARSEKLPDGTRLECVLEVYDGPITEEILRDLLSYGERKGLGQWRNGGNGRFTFELVPLD